MRIKKTLTIGAVAIGLVCLLNQAAYADPITINDAGVVGAFTGEVLQGQGGTAVEQELAAAQHLLDMAINSTDPTNCSLSGNGDCYKTGDNDYSGTLSGGTQIDGGTTDLSAAIAAGAVWVLAKYDGQNAGYVMFNLADWIAAGNTSLPQTSADIWSNGQDNGYDISHYTYFTASVPDGGATLILLGAALGGLGVLRRRMNV
jgi:hypothetical protein